MINITLNCPYFIRSSSLTPKLHTEFLLLVIWPLIYRAAENALGEENFPGPQQGRRGKWKNKETKQTASYARWPLAASAFNKTNPYLITPGATETQEHIEHSRPSGPFPTAGPREIVPVAPLSCRHCFMLIRVRRERKKEKVTSVTSYPPLSYSFKTLLFKYLVLLAAQITTAVCKLYLVPMIQNL
jgi:hypothetical protein